MLAPFKKMENITYFTDAARMLGVNESSMFATVDLFEEKNMNSVISCLYTFAGTIQTTVPEYNGPKLGLPIEAVVKDAAREKVMATQMGGLTGTLDNKTVTGTGDRTFGAKAAGAEVNGTGEADAHGLDDDLKEKMAAKGDPELDARVCKWIEEVTKVSQGGVSMAEWLKDGIVLCALANAIQPNSVPHVNNGGGAFKLMENIKSFLGFARTLGMAESSLFSTNDLFEAQNMPIVSMALFNFSGVVRAKVERFSGPYLSDAVIANVNDTSRGLALVTDQNEAAQRHMEVDKAKDFVGNVRPLG